MTHLTDILRRAGVAAAMTAATLGLMTLFEAPATQRSNSAAAPENTIIAQMISDWSGDIDYAPPYNALLPTARQSAGADGMSFDPEDALYGLPRAEGAEDTALYCSACHSLEIVMQQRQTREGWRYLLAWMNEQQGMPALPDAEYARILDYLSSELGEAAAN